MEVPDERQNVGQRGAHHSRRKRTFGMDPLFAEFGIYHPEGQLYKPVDHNVLMKYKESEKGQLFEEGINEAGATSTFIASATSYSTPLYQRCPSPFYSMFGFNVADLVVRRRPACPWFPRGCHLWTHHPQR